MAQVDLYLQIVKNLVRGRNIMTMYFTSYEDLNGELRGTVQIKYLCGELVQLPLETPLTPEQIDIILEQVCILQEQPCYPHTGSACELGITKLN